MRTLYSLAPIDGEDSLANPLPLLSYLDRELWADMYGFKGFYLISTYGNVISNHYKVERRKAVKWCAHRNEWVVELHIEGKRHYRALSRLMKLTFDPVPGMDVKVVTFKNGNPQNVTLENLVWSDASKSKLTASDVRAIRATPYGKYITAELAMKYGVSPRTIEKVLDFASWHWIKDGAE